MAELDPKILTSAKETLQKAVLLAPTDPKVRYFLSLVEFSAGDNTDGLADLQRTLELKPNYDAALSTLKDIQDKLASEAGKTAATGSGKNKISNNTTK